MNAEDEKIKNVCAFINGMVMAFNAAGQQIGKYQGRYSDVAESILRDAADDVEFEYMQSIQGWRKPIDRKQFSELVETCYLELSNFFTDAEVEQMINNNNNVT